LDRPHDHPGHWTEVALVRLGWTGVTLASFGLRQCRRREHDGEDHPPDNIKSERVILRVTPHRQTIVDQKNDVGTED
jgi:hypothetical protein